MLLIHPPIAPWLVRAGDGCRVTLLCGGTPGVVYLRAEPDNEELLIAMHEVGRVGEFARFDGHVGWDRANPATHYAFKVLESGRQIWLAADGMHAHAPPRELHFKICRADTPPDWV
ncbi:MAG TPA: hypothetical protein VF469_05430, partial [Kofleriaceae bacterium]